MDPLVRALGAVKRELYRIVGRVDSPADQLMLIEYAERQLAEIRGNIIGEQQGKPS